MLFRIEVAALQSLIDSLRQRKFTVVGPTQRGGAIVYDEVRTVTDLPAGWTDEQSPGYYRIQKRTDKALFGFAVGPQSWKKYLFPPVLRLIGFTRTPHGFSLQADGAKNSELRPEKIALIGVRACELKALEIQDNVFGTGPYRDPYYLKLREQLCIIAVQCSSPSETCFCASMNTGPNVQGSYDMVLTEVLEGDEHFFIAEAGSKLGESLMDKAAKRVATADEQAKAQAVVSNARSRMKRTLDTDAIRDILYQNADNPEWDKVGERCLSCTNCTMVCPTCFCSCVEDTTDLTGSEAIRTRKWDSCFTLDFSYIHGGSVRTSVKSRYRQWMTHKLASWLDQFGTLGCVGCGRCITWCPVGIDITDEARVIRESTKAAK